MMNMFAKICRIAWLVMAMTVALGPASTDAQQASRFPTNLPAAPKTPNIVLIVADDLGYGDLGCYGQTKVKTPHLDALAATGTRFTSFYAGSTVCAPSRCALMTGKHTGHATLRGNTPGAALKPEDITLAQLLKDAGYATGLMGKWGLGDVGSTGMPGDKGFDEFVGILNQKRAHDYYPPYADRFDRQDGFRLFQFPQNENGGQGLYFPDLFTKCSSNFIRINRPQWYTQQRPVFLYVAQTLPHANNELGIQTGNGMQVPSDAPYGEELWPPAERNKAAMITRLDQSVGQIVAAIKEHKQESNTLILFTSDNGPHKEGGVDPEFFRSSGPLRGIKRDLYEGGIRVPLIAVWPGKIPAGQVSDEPWAFWDMLPTLAELGQARVPKGIDGISYVPTLLGQAQTNRHDHFYWEFNERGFQQAVRMGRWKGVRAGAESSMELYDLGKDIGETLNVADKNPEVVARISGILRTARTEPAVNTRRKP